MFHEEAPSRIIGTECEYDIQGKVRLNHDGRVPIDPEFVRSNGLRLTGQFLTNGAKLYPDVGHLEYATPECLGPKESAAADAAGIQIASKFIGELSKEARGYRRSGTYIPNEDDKEYTKGYHESYLTTRHVEREERDTLTAVVPAFLATRMWAWAGAVTKNGFVLSQKASGLGEAPPISDSLVARTIQGKKPMAIILPNPCEVDKDIFTGEEHAAWARLEVRFADPVLSPTIQFASRSAMSTVLRLVEHADIYRERLRELQLKLPYTAAQVVSTDLSLKETILTADHARVTALDIQERLYELAVEFSAKFEIPSDEVEALGVWRELIDGLRASNPAEADYPAGIVSEQVHFAAKHSYIAGLVGTTALSNRNAMAVQRDTDWDRVYPIGGAMKWSDHFASEHVDNADITRLMTEAPLATRAAERSRMISFYGDAVTSVSWNTLKLGKDTYYVGNIYN